MRCPGTCITARAVRVVRAVAGEVARSAAARENKLGVDRFHYPIALALGGLIFESLISTRRRKVAP